MGLMNLKMQRRKLSDEDPMLLLDFLVQVWKDTDTLEMIEALAYVILPYFLSEITEYDYSSVRGSSVLEHSYLPAYSLS